MSGSQRVGGAVVLALVVAAVAWLIVGTRAGVASGVVVLVALAVVPQQWRIMRTSSPERTPPWQR